jgi:hypothetical protein
MTFLLSSSLLFAERKISEEAKVFNQVKDSVFTVFGDSSHGTGFLIDFSGLVLTNHHVVAGARYPRVQINDQVKVSATVLAMDAATDVAVLLVNPSIIQGIVPLELATSSDDIVYVGERLIAVGSPLNQIRILTSGMASKLEEDVIISDVNINPGNSGGPLINMDGVVVGINTFLNVGNIGPNLSGSLLITEAINVIEEAKLIMGDVVVPSPELLPVPPKDIFPLEGLQEAAFGSIAGKKFNDKHYNLNVENFRIAVVTPPYDYYRTHRFKTKLKLKRKVSEILGGLESQTGIELLPGLYRWRGHVGHFSPIVKFEIAPKTGQTGSSKVLNFLGALAAGYSGQYYRGNYTYEYKGDIYDFKVYRNGILITDIQRSMSLEPFVLNESNWNGNFKAEDIAQTGIFRYPIEMFKPETDGFPTIVLVIYDLKSPDIPVRMKLPVETIYQVWKDFAAYTGDVSTIRKYEELSQANDQQKKYKRNNSKPIVRFSILAGFIFMVVMAIAESSN